MENELISTEQLVQLIETKNVKEIRRIFEVVPTIDIAEAIDDIEDVKQIVFIFKTVKSEYTADLFAELHPDTKEKLIAAMSDSELADIIESQFTDDLVDDIEDLPANLVYRVLKNVSKERRATINRLLNYKENTAGSIMTTEFLVLLDTLSVDEAIAQIRKVGKTKETIYTLFIIDKRRNLVGTLDLDDLIFAKGDEILSDLMNRDFVTVNINTDQEEVANLIKRYDLNAIAVLNNEDRLVGIITVDDIIDVIEQEATEDVAALSHVTPLEDSYLDTSPFSMAKKCVPWIIILLILGTFTTMVLDKLQDQAVFTMVPILIAFVPTLMDTGGNAGGQTIALMIRGLATKEFTPRDFLKVILKEVLTALIVSSVILVFSFLWFTMEQYTGIVGLNINDPTGPAMTIWNKQCWSMDFFAHAVKVSATVSITLFAASFIAKFVAVCLPLGVAALKKDPAIVAQPLLTTIVDVLALISYLGIATIAFTLI
ncbi:MAG: magnesium transporter [Bacilli bacterium]|nr:magnesium transporter [Bacilli bacterium]